MVRNDRVRYERVTTGICRYHCSRVIGISPGDVARRESSARTRAPPLDLTKPSGRRNLKVSVDADS